jgi:hypothetical protein
MDEKPLVNRVANSGIATIDLEHYFPAEEIVSFDLKDYLFHGLILKEKDFREALDNLDWEQFRLVAVQAQPFAVDVYYGPPAQALDQYYRDALSKQDWGHLADQRVVVKGCSDKPVPPSAYLEAARLFRPLVKSLMFGEPCSTVPLFKKK